MLDQLRQMAIFAKVVDHGSFRGAAESLGLSPSVVSHHISQLEDSLNVALFYRSTRKVSLTHDGEALLIQAHIMIEAAERGLAELSSNADEPSGVLRITLPAVMAHSPLITKLASFSRLYPQIQLTIDFSDERRSVIDQGYDVAIRVGWLEDSALKAKKLYDSQRLMVASKDFFAQAPPTHPSELMKYRWITLNMVKNPHLTLTKGGETFELAPKAVISLNDASAMARFAAQGAGLAVIPSFLLDGFQDAENLQTILPEWKLSELGVYAVWPSNAPKNSLTKLLVEHLAK